MSDTVRLNLNIPRDLYERFQKFAADNERSAGAEIRFLMREALAARSPSRTERGER